jgi:cell wall-associated NlpC family hydrolase
MSTKQMVKTAYANIYREPNFSSEMITQALFFETLEVQSEHDNWLKISQWDGYVGYVHKFYLCNVDANKGDSAILTDRLTPIYTAPDSINISMLAPFGSRISYSQYTNHWCHLKLDSLDYYFKAPEKINTPITRDTLIDHCNRLIGSPYLWGGKTPLGYDCSGFVQEIFKSVDINLKRDTSQQIEDDRFPSIELSSAQRGDIMFFDFEKKGVDHVGICYGDDQIIHCGGYVKIQSIHDDSHKKLLDYIVEIKSIKNHLNG